MSERTAARHQGWLLGVLIAVSLGGSFASRSKDTPTDSERATVAPSDAPRSLALGSPAERSQRAAVANGASETGPTSKRAFVAFEPGLNLPRHDALHPMTSERRVVIDERSARAATLNSRLEAHLARLRARRVERSDSEIDRKALDHDIEVLERNLASRRGLETLVPGSERPGSR